MKKKAWSQIIRNIITISFLIGISILSYKNYNVVVSPVRELLHGTSNYQETVSKITKGYLSDSLWKKNSFVNLNGFFARITGRRTYNSITRLNNGMLTFGTNNQQVSRDEKNINPTAKSLTSFSNYLSLYNIPFVYIQAPGKMSTDCSMLPYGVQSYADKNVNNLLSKLRENNVEYYDLRPFYCQNVNLIEKYFYRTDNHWNADGAFLAYQLIVDEIEKRTNTNIDKTLANINLWSRQVLPHWFLGSHGKRVGSFFAGTDPLIWYTPLFDTDLSTSVPHRKEFFKGTFTEANILQKYIESSNYFEDNAYNVYIGGGYPLVWHRNAYAPNKMKILILKDSFTQPVQAFLSTSFTEVDVVDPRYYTYSTISEYVAWTKPNIVIMLINPTEVGNSKYAELGCENAPNYLNKKMLLENYKLTIEDNKDKYNQKKIPVDLVEGQTYSISFNYVNVIKGDTKGVGILLYDRNNHIIINHAIFDIEYCNKSHVYNWTFSVPKDMTSNANYQLLFYAGIHGKTNDISVEYLGIQVEQLI